MQRTQRVSVVIPVYNESANLPALFSALRAAAGAVDAEVEFLFVDDGSDDGSLSALEAFAAEEPRAKVLGLARNFGKEIAVTAGIRHASGDACLTMDADLQHPPERIPAFVDAWRAGAEVVVGIRTRQEDAPWWRRAGSAAFYQVLSRISDTPVTRDATDFRLIDRVVIDEFNRFTERRRLTRSLIDWLGFRRAYVPFEAPARPNGRSRYGLVTLVRLAAFGFVSQSLFPLKIAGYLGALITLSSGTLGLFILVESYVLGDPLALSITGTATLAVINLFLIGIVLCCLGVIALYIANIHAEVANRPLYAVRVRRGLDGPRV